MSEVPKCIQKFKIHPKANVLAILDYDYSIYTSVYMYRYIYTSLYRYRFIDIDLCIDTSIQLFTSVNRSITYIRFRITFLGPIQRSSPPALPKTHPTKKTLLLLLHSWLYCRNCILFYHRI